VGKFTKIKPGFNLKDDAVPFSKHKQESVKGAPKATGQLFTGVKKKPDLSAQEAMLEQQAIMRAQLDEEENRKRKRLLSAAQGIRSYRGSIFSRSGPSNTSGGASSSQSSAAAAASVGGRGFKAGTGGSYQ
jgi:hypothetical protein